MFTSNLERVNHFFKVLAATTQSITFKLDKLAEKHHGSDLKQKLDQIKREIDAKQEWESSILEWFPVMLVTFTEAYLQDLLAYVAALDVSLMGKSEQTATYSDVLQAQSIPDLAADLRARWARGIVDDGGPQRWSKRLPQILQFPPKRYPSDLIERLETLWGVRHVVVHAAGTATRDFVSRHPEFDVGVGEQIRFSVNDDRLMEWYKAVQSFATVTDESVVARTAAVIDRAASRFQK